MDDEILERILWDVKHAEEQPETEPFDFDIQPVLEKLGLSDRFTQVFGVG